MVNSSREPATTELLSCEGLAVRRGRRHVLSHVCLTMRAGETAYLFGDNGCGKTSLLRVLAGIAHPAAGSVSRVAPCAYVPEKVVLASSLRPAEWLNAMRGGAPCAWSSAVIASGLDIGVLGMRSSALSKGMLQRIALVEALHSECPLLLLDEPFAGLDAAGRDWLARRVAERVGAGAAVIFTDHSDAAGSRLAAARRLTLTGGGCIASGPVRAAALVRITATNSTGERVTHEVDEAAGDAVLSQLLAAGWHIEDVGR